MPGHSQNADQPVGTLSAAPRRLDRISPAAALLLPATPPAIDNRRGQPPLYVFNGATMADATQATVSSTPALVVAAPRTLGQSLDADLVAVKARVASLEAAAKTDWATVVAWVKTNWAHIALTWPAAGVILVPAVKEALKVIL